MRPKEMLEKLGVKNDRIHLFKKKGIFKPENPPVGTKPTNYTDVDFSTLERIVILTRFGVTISDIKKLQSGKLSLSEIAISRKHAIEEDIKRKNNDLEHISLLIQDTSDFDNYDVEHYRDIITQSEEYRCIA